MWEAMDAELGTVDSEVSLPLCAGFRAPVEGLAVQLVAAAAVRAMAVIEDMRAKTWKTVVTEPCGLETELGLPPGMGLPGRVAQIAKGVVSSAVSHAIERMQMRRAQKWRAISIECPCPAKVDSGLPLARGLPKRASQLAADVVAAGVERAIAAMVANASPAKSGLDSDCWCPQCAICLEKVARPVELPCGHVFCADCLLRLVSAERSYRNRACPLCRGQLFVVPEDETEDVESEYGEADICRWSHMFHCLPGDLFVYCSFSRVSGPSLETPRTDRELHPG